MLTCKIFSKEAVHEYGNLIKVELPAYNGTMQIFTGHAETFLKLKSGAIVFEQKSGKVTQKEVPQAECHITNNLITIII